MIITFATIIFAFLFLFKGAQKNTFFLLYAFSMIGAAYYCENFSGWRVHYFSKAAFMLFLLFHIVLINIFTFWAYGRDKKCATRGDWRIPETHLHTLELLGGTLGALLGQKIFHHKNKKKAYKATFYAVIFIQLSITLIILRKLGFL